jgi:hypothetical protein
MLRTPAGAVPPPTAAAPAATLPATPDPIDAGRLWVLGMFAEGTGAPMEAGSGPLEGIPGGLKPKAEAAARI